MVKRFIAGAVCPSCGAKDSLRMEYLNDGTEMVRDCVDCGFTDTLSAEASSATLPGTRVEAAPRDDDRQVIRIMPPTKPK